MDHLLETMRPEPAPAASGPERADSCRAPHRPRIRPARIALWTGVGVLALAVVWFARSVTWSTLEVDAIARRVHGAGAAAPVALFVLLVIQCVVSPLPSEPLMMAAGFLYGPGGGFALSWSAVLLGATACFWIARRFGRRAAERFVGRDKLAALDETFARRGLIATFAIVLAVRVFAHGSFDVVSYACGLVGLPLPLFLIASGVGAIPKVFAFTYLGASTGSRPAWLDALILGGIFGMVLLAAAWRRAKPARDADADLTRDAAPAGATPGRPAARARRSRTPAR